jgi:SAM-dependent methyltransferase
MKDLQRRVRDVRERGNWPALIRARPAVSRLLSSVRMLEQGTPIRRLNWGCGPTPPPGWINADRIVGPGIAIVRDVRHGLPLRDDDLDYVVSIHGLQDVPYLDVVPALGELRRVLKPGGILRLALPDLDRSIRAYLAGDARYFHVPDGEVRSLGGKLVVQAIWYGSTRTPFTLDFIEELLTKAGFVAVHRCGFRETRSGFAPGIVALDNRERESLFVEAVK